MLRNYLLIAYRNLWHNKVYALINILGLGIGLTAALFIFQYVQFERSYDNFHTNVDNIYRVTLQATINGNQRSPVPVAPSDFGPAAKRECPEVLAYARLFQNKIDDFIISYQGEDGTSPIEFLEQEVYYTEASLLAMFSFPMLAGDAKTLQEPNALLISESMAQKFFGSDWQATNPIGKLLTINGKDNFMLQGVFKDIPDNSHIKFEVLLSLTTLAEAIKYDTEPVFPFRVYLQVDSRADINKLETQIKKIQDKYLGDLLRQVNMGDAIVITLQPVRDAHLYSSGLVSEPEIRGSATTVQFLFITACFILLLAWINYVNLSTARAVKRAKEVGIRKVVGAGRRQLITQFLLEAFLINLLSIVVAMTLYQLFYTSFTSMVERNIPQSSLLEEPWFLVGIGLVLILGTLLSGGYSAFVLSSFKAVSIMKGKFHTSVRGVLLRKSLIVFQFVISVGLIMATFSVYRQLMFMKNFEMGYDMSQKLIVRAPMITDENYAHHYESFKTALQQLPDISQITASLLSPGDSRGKGDQFVLNKKQPEKQMYFSLNVVDYDYLDTYQMKLLYGRSFSREFPSDKDAVVITEDVAQLLGFDPVETALQEKIVIGPDWLKKETTIIGIVKNLNFYSLKLERNGIVFLLPQEDAKFSTSGPFHYFTIDLDNLSHLQENMARIEALYTDHFPGNPFSYFFLDDYFNTQYRTEEQYGKVFSTASGLAIFIACLGLFGLSAFIVKQRTKEIGIRKVLGASVQSILLLFSKDYCRLIVLASFIALPLTYLTLNQWLENYMYRIQLSWWLFLLPVFIVVLIALVTVSVQTIKAALANPSHSLRNE